MQIQTHVETITCLLNLGHDLMASLNNALVRLTYVSLDYPSADVLRHCVCKILISTYFDELYGSVRDTFLDP